MVVEFRVVNGPEVVEKEKVVVIAIGMGKEDVWVVDIMEWVGAGEVSGGVSCSGAKVDDRIKGGS